MTARPGADASGPSEPTTTLDAFLGGRIRIEQPAQGYRAGLDAVLLAATVSEHGEDGPARILDIGAGVGAIGLCIAARLGTVRVVLLEREPALAAIAGRNIAANGLGARVRVISATVGGAAGELLRAGLEDATFDQVVANPPYHATGRGTPAPDALKAASHAMPEESLDGWIRFMARMAKPGGSGTIVHKADALAQVLASMRGRFGAIIVLPIHPRAGEPASRIIVRGSKGSRGPLRLLPGFVLHGPGNGFLPEADAILRSGAALPLRAGGPA